MGFCSAGFLPISEREQESNSKILRSKNKYNLTFYSCSRTLLSICALTDLHGSCIGFRSMNADRFAFIQMMEVISALATTGVMESFASLGLGMEVVSIRHTLTPFASIEFLQARICSDNFTGYLTVLEGGESVFVSSTTTVEELLTYSSSQVIVPHVAKSIARPPIREVGTLHCNNNEN